MVDAVPPPEPVPLPGGATLRPLEPADAAALLDVHERNREHVRHATQRVLAGNGFERIGAARDYLFLDGAWRDALVFKRILNDRRPAAGSA
ncbi:hypothetical protein [Dactylosporangium sp. NPDC000521]|uniref:hypothetical protein n=1 Tax=Dactylosporangium sp. NPDC000521 TaxID=3363975 RepID=UPI003689F5E4